MASVVVAAWQRAAFVLLGTVAVAAATCYHPDGSAADSTYQPCNGSVAVSMCCHLGYVNNGGDACGSASSYGLCGITGTQLWRESCTDSTWMSPSCLKLCLDAGPGDQMITACSDESYCCGQNNATCCDAGQGQFIVNDLVSNTSSVSSSASSTMFFITSSTPTSSATSPSTISASTTLSSTPSPSASTSATATSSASTGLASGSKVGIGVAVPLGVIALALLAAFFFRKRRARAPADDLNGICTYAQDSKDMHEKAGRARGELEYAPPRVEMDGQGPTTVANRFSSRPVELPAAY